MALRARRWFSLSTRPATPMPSTTARSAPPAAPTAPVLTFLVAGLGNTGHNGERHNVGFTAIDHAVAALASKYPSALVAKWSPQNKTCVGATALATLSGAELASLVPMNSRHRTKTDAPVADVNELPVAKIVFLRPKGFMNLIGVSIAKAAAHHKIPPSRILIVHDELEKKLGTVAVKHGGGAAGHNGLRSITACLRTSEYSRVRIGVGRPKNGEVAEYVLQKFPEDEVEVLEETVYDQVLAACLSWVRRAAEEEVAAVKGASCRGNAG
ncbi:hypothetical protein HDU83_003300 [Entophlyctis luteolus]|nr:hypothetical protein HDU83_003300 [Entophlyctis luteolus]KAJ3385312.1 hypothetical protein HDU84_002310 [Entophlyctis sp. JEL0112]